MRPLVERRGRKLEWFRYPFLHSGTTEEVHQAVIDFLARRGYRVAPVTVDYADYTFAGVFRNQRLAGTEDVAERIKRAYLEQVDLGFEYAEKASVELFGHEIPQILLIHCNELNALTLGETIARLRTRGYTFIPLGEAMADAAYARPDTFTGPGGSWLSRTATAMGRKITGTRPPIPEWITRIGTDAASRPRTETRASSRVSRGLEGDSSGNAGNAGTRRESGPDTDRARPRTRRCEEEPSRSAGRRPVLHLVGRHHGAVGRVAAAPARADRSLRSRPHPLAREAVRLPRASPDRSGRSGAMAGRRAERWRCGGLARARVPGLRADLARPGHHPNRRRPRGREAGSVQGARGWCDRPAGRRRNARQLAAGLDRGVPREDGGCEAKPHSSRKAIRGSIRAARRAGR